jgi:hypothetical protein
MGTDACIYAKDGECGGGREAISKEALNPTGTHPHRMCFLRCVSTPDATNRTTA